MDERTIGRWIAAANDRDPRRHFLGFQGDSFDVGDVETLTNRYANGFAALGVGKGDRVSILMRNRPEYLWALWGLGKIGAVPVTVNVLAKGDLLAYFISQSRSSWLVLADEFVADVAAVAGRLPDLGGVLLADSERRPELEAAGLATRPLAAVVDAGAERPPLDAVDGSDPGAIFYTSGTTGPSKGVLTPHSQACALATQVTDFFGLGTDDVLFTCLPMFHCNAIWYTAYSALLCGGSMALVERFSASRFWQDVTSAGATQFNFMGAMANIIKSLDPTDAERRNQVHTSLIGPATADVVELFDQRYGIEVVTGYGSTETYLACRFRPLRTPEKIGTAGVPSPGGAIRIFGADGECAVGETGELQIRPEDRGWILQGYFDMEEATAATFDGEWFRTGDRAFLDEDGYLHFVDRIKDSIRRRGENISAFEIESAIQKLPAVEEVAAIPVPSELGEDDVMVWIVPRPGHSVEPEELIAHCEGEMGRYMIPRFVEVVAALPKTPTSRIEKYKLREWAAERRDSLWDREAETAPAPRPGRVAGPAALSDPSRPGRASR